MNISLILKALQSTKFEQRRKGNKAQNSDSNLPD